MAYLLQSAPPLRTHTHEMEVFITVPHAYCPESEVRLCDLAALKAANALRKALMDANLPSDVIIHFHRPETLRETGDLNRRETRKWPWRRAIQRKVKAARRARKKVILFDMHSFPDDAEDFKRDIHEHPGPKVVLLDTLTLFQQPTMEVGWTHREMVRRVEAESGVDVRIIAASDKNDITVRARRILPDAPQASNTDTMLWEFNEDSTRLTTAELERVALALANYVRRRYSAQ